MRWISVILFCAVLTSTWAAPDPKKYKSQIKDKTKAFDTSLTDDERKFLREVESKFGIKSNVPLEENNDNVEADKVKNSTAPVKAPFPAVIAIEIVNDTDSNTKGKRTIDANLGYGYRTTNGYTYTYMGKPQEKGKFMIYPYSQEDIPPARPSFHSSYRYNSHSPHSTVEIQPSRAYELIEMENDKDLYHFNKHSSSPSYQNIKGLVSPPALPQTANPTFYATYNGHQFSALSSQFPTVMSNYLVDSSQLIKNPQYQSAGINQEYIRNHASQIDQRVVPVLVLRVPSSYLKKPTAELYADTPHNYPVSHYLNNINLQELVNNYFKKIGYSFAPQVMTYQSSLLSQPIATSEAPTAAPQYESHKYANPYVNPSYSNADYSGVQYSAVQPVMAKYPSSYTRQMYYLPMTQTAYQQPEQQYQYTYQYTPQTDDQSQQYYVHSHYQTEAEAGAPSSESKGEVATVEVANSGQAGYTNPHQTASEESVTPSAEYGVPETQTTANHEAEQQIQYVSSQEASQSYEQPKATNIEYKNTLSTEYGPANEAYTVYNSEHSSPQYSESAQNVPANSFAYYQRHFTQGMPKYIMSAVKSSMQNYYFQKQMNEDAGSNSLILSENYPSDDHTLATVLPISFTRDRKPASVQSVSYVTPSPHKYQSRFRVMVPQTVLHNPSTEKVEYVHSQSLSAHQQSPQEYNSEEEYTVPVNYSPPVSQDKPPAYPRNYHSYKRNTRPEKKSTNESASKSKQARSQTVVEDKESSKTE